MPSLGHRVAGGLRLVFFPFAGGGASAFRDWQTHFPDSIETYTLQYPGRETRWGDPAYAELADLAAAIADEFVPHLKAPYAFLGHSMGAVVAFEVTRLLRTGANSVCPCIFSSRVSGLIGSHGTSTCMLARTRTSLRELRSYGGLPVALLENEDFLRVVLPIADDFRLYERRTVLPGDPLPIPITAFGGTDDDKVSIDSVLA